MEAKARCLLFYLLSISLSGGECRPGYAAMRKALVGAEGKKGSDATVKSALETLDKAGWIHHRHRTNGIMRIYLHVPMRFRPVPKKHVQIALFPKSKT
tara:strand:- start:343 stop:636 length:294 start_codon:yes stop_codon:yes gene_type:complete